MSRGKCVCEFGTVWATPGPMGQKLLYASPDRMHKRHILVDIPWGKQA
jgi:hypothetical protein